MGQQEKLWEEEFEEQRHRNDEPENLQQLEELTIVNQLEIRRLQEKKKNSHKSSPINRKYLKS